MQAKWHVTFIHMILLSTFPTVLHWQVILMSVAQVSTHFVMNSKAFKCFRNMKQIWPHAEKRTLTQRGKRTVSKRGKRILTQRGKAHRFEAQRGKAHRT